LRSIASPDMFRSDSNVTTSICRCEQAESIVSVLPVDR
jgi:hypothetical protein